MQVVPFKPQAIDILRELQPHTGRNVWVFTGAQPNGVPMSKNTVNAAL